MRLTAKVFTNPEVEIVSWVAARIPFVGARGFGSANGLGVVDSNDRPLCGVAFHDWQPEFNTMSFSIAAVSPRWATRSIIKQLLAYPFEQVKVRKLWTATPSSNERAIRLIKGVGFKREAILSHHFGKDHAIISRMFVSDFRRLYGKDQ